MTRPAEQADEWSPDSSGTGDSRSTGSRASGSWDPGDAWTDNDLGATTQWARRDTGSQPQSKDSDTGAATGWGRTDGWGTGPQHSPWQPEAESPLSSGGEQPRHARDGGSQPPASGTGSQPVASTGGQPRYPWRSGPQRSVPDAGSEHAASTGEQPRRPWDSGPQAPVAGTGSQPAASTGEQSRRPWDSGPQAPVAGTGSQPAASTGGQPAARAPWESPGWSDESGWDATTDRDVAADRGAGALTNWGASPEREDTGPSVPEPGTGSGPWPVAARPGRPERGLHRAAKHGKPSRWRGAGDRSDGES